MDKIKINDVAEVIIRAIDDSGIKLNNEEAGYALMTVLGGYIIYGAFTVTEDPFKRFAVINAARELNLGHLEDITSQMYVTQSKKESK